MSPNAAEVEPLIDMNRFAKGTTLTRIVENMGGGIGISVHLTTFNCANVPHTRFPLALPTSPPDLIVLGLQELAPSHIAFLNLAVIENTYLKGVENVPDIARKKYGKEYELVKTVRVGQTALVVWSSLGQRLKKVRIAWAGCGLFGLLANKGAAAARVTVVNDEGRDREVTFVAAHLAAHEGHFYRRNADFQSLVQNLVFQDQTGIFKPNTPLFFLGDLNYRLSVLHPSRSGSKLNITPEEISQEDLSLMATLKENIIDFLETGKFSHLVPHDQLPLSPLALHLYETPITFSPTYKYISHDPPTYALNRTPSWTDRILYSPETILTENYRSTTCATFSDHQAVSLTAILRTEDFECEEGTMPWETNPAWRERREFAEKLAYAVGGLEFIGGTKVGILIVVILSGMTMYLYF